MRYALYVAALLSDVLVLAVLGFMLWQVCTGTCSPSILFILALALHAWFKAGGFDTWRPSRVRTAMARMKALGL
jgi:hypothetical protein